MGATLSDPATLTASVHNPGAHTLRPVVFAHAGVDQSEWERPSRRLVGFARVLVEPGATIDVDIELDWSMLDVRCAGEWSTESGEYVLDVGRHAGDPQAVTIRLQR